MPIETIAQPVIELVLFSIFYHDTRRNFDLGWPGAAANLCYWGIIAALTAGCGLYLAGNESILLTYTCFAAAVLVLFLMPIEVYLARGEASRQRHQSAQWLVPTTVFSAWTFALFLRGAEWDWAWALLAGAVAFGLLALLAMWLRKAA